MVLYKNHDKNRRQRSAKWSSYRRRMAVRCHRRDSLLLPSAIHTDSDSGGRESRHYDVAMPRCHAPAAVSIADFSIYARYISHPIVPLQHNARSNGPRTVIIDMYCSCYLRSTSQCRKVKFREQRNVMHWALTDAFPYYMIQRRGTNVTE